MANESSEDEGISWGRISIGCIGILVVLGLVAALFVVPAFERYRNRSKAVQAEVDMDRITQDAKAHYERYGHFFKPGETVKTAPSPPEGSARVKPNTGDSIMGFTGSNRYFQYVHSARGEGEEATATIKARADLDPSTEAVHTVTQTLEVEQGQVVINTRKTQNELE